MTTPNGGGGGYWPGRWPGEDGGPDRRAAPRSGPGLGLAPGDGLRSTFREAVVATMVVLRDPGEVYLLGHTAGDSAVAWVERIDPVTLAPRGRSPDLPGGRVWPGGVAVHANGDLYTVFGRHAHRLSPELEVVAARELPRDLPYNSFVILPDGHLATKDFGGALPGGVAPPGEPAELVVLEPDGLRIVARLALPERSIARLSADGPDVYAVGEAHVWRARWDGTTLVLDDGWTPRYRTLDGQGYGWDAVLALGAAWFLDNGEGTEAYPGTFRGHGVARTPLHLVRADLGTGAVALTEIGGEAGGIVANPPAVDPSRGIVVGYDSGHGVMTAFDVDGRGVTGRRWTRRQDHACHAIVFPDTGELVTADHDAGRMADQVVVLDVETGEERARVDTGSPIQSVVFPAPGFGRDVYHCSFPGVSRIAVDP